MGFRPSTSAPCALGARPQPCLPLPLRLLHLRPLPMRWCAGRGRGSQQAWACHQGWGPARQPPTAHCLWQQQTGYCCWYCCLCQADGILPAGRQHAPHAPHPPSHVQHGARPLRPQHRELRLHLLRGRPVTCPRRAGGCPGLPFSCIRQSQLGRPAGLVGCQDCLGRTPWLWGARAA